MTTGEFLLHKKLSWYESDPSGIVSSHINFFQFLVYTIYASESTGEKNVMYGILQKTYERIVP